jgi:hypothetical protein
LPTRRDFIVIGIYQAAFNNAGLIESRKRQ